MTPTQQTAQKQTARNTYECPRCHGGKGVISAFKHVQGGVCFKCGGKGFVVGKPSAPQQCFIAMQKWDDPSDCNYNGGDFIVTFRFKARNQKDADKKLATKLGNSGREFYALAAEHAPG